MTQTLAERLGTARIGAGDTFDMSKSENAKRVVLAKVFGLDDEDIEELLQGIQKLLSQLMTYASTAVGIRR